MKRLLIGAILGLFLIGCNSDQEESGPSGPAMVTFDGKVDEGLVGTWKTSNGDSVLTLDKDGALQIGSTFNTPNGKQNSSKKGKWLSSGEKLKMQYEESDGTLLTIAYDLKKTGDTMVLSTKTPKLETTYKKQ